MKKVKVIIGKIKPLKKTVNPETKVESNDRFSLFEDQENFCVYTLQDGDTVEWIDAADHKKGAKSIKRSNADIKIGDTVIGLEKFVPGKDKETCLYFLKHYSLEVAKADANRDYNAEVANLKLEDKAALAERIGAASMADFEAAA